MDVSKAVVVIEMGISVGVASLTITRSRPLRPVREWIWLRSGWWGELVSCPYCMAHWLAAAVLALYWPGWRQAILEWLIVVAIGSITASWVYRAIIVILPTSSEVIHAEPKAKQAA